MSVLITSGSNTHGVEKLQGRGGSSVNKQMHDYRKLELSEIYHPNSAIIGYTASVQDTQ